MSEDSIGMLRRMMHFWCFTGIEIVFFVFYRNDVTTTCFCSSWPCLGKPFCAGYGCNLLFWRANSCKVRFCNNDWFYGVLVNIVSKELNPNTPENVHTYKHCLEEQNIYKILKLGPYCNMSAFSTTVLSGQPLLHCHFYPSLPLANVTIFGIFLGLSSWMYSMLR